MRSMPGNGPALTVVIASTAGPFDLSTQGGCAA
jgi:hypothetical protein